ncbi:23513_t:CDS:2 [Dentiscutata erythropus]|uniref:23513_t:CDS:1 n=1 Tax=Dentiscutata erythropus TaxID=1348616 RepID=A0A9N9ES66_9GLOM|nr:23513_t:CDS:2 [Dentiscutata erythropus]
MRKTRKGCVSSIKSLSLRQNTNFSNRNALQKFKQSGINDKEGDKVDVDSQDEIDQQGEL